MQPITRQGILTLMVCSVIFFGCSGGDHKFGNVHRESSLSPGTDGLREKINPHRGKHCLKCHVTDGNELFDLRKKKGRQDFSPETNFLKANLNKLCASCHDKKKGDHPVGAAPGINRLDLPLDEKGKINCAATCHDVHISNENISGVKKGLLRAPAEKLCLSCHDV